MSDTSKCDVEDCPDQAVRKKWCSKHYQRWRRYGDPLTVKARWSGHELVSSRSCSVPGCEEPVLAKDLCSRDYRRWQTHGDPTIVLKGGVTPYSENYSAQHKRIAKARGRASRCEHCGTSDPTVQFGWAFDHVGDRNDVYAYLELCRSCHWKFDMTPEALEQLAAARVQLALKRAERRGGDALSEPPPWDTPTALQSPFALILI